MVSESPRGWGNLTGPTEFCERPHSSAVNNSFQEIVGYLESQYDDILAEENRIKRNPRFRDNRVHALLYFIAPTGHA
jgi:septin family protein